MEKDIEFINRKEYFEVIFKGERTFEDLNNLIEKSYIECQKNNFNRILLDLCEAKGYWIGLDRFRIAEKASHLFKYAYKILVIDKEEMINKFGENTAVNRGVNILITSDKINGLDWLLIGNKDL
jgi:hypothetical protein